ncbi:hypothetical protein G7Y89_g12087 [Cudoniella acicularis]|uniref:Dynamin-type G domain-containing protein n=1 Tax=Cudoniella acicularis TaxID=354080 RepID=A0A8H4R9S3_9HELO|nr:hypothetical protein G7Y89_g12087 [Cudoniella acicularis]
MNSNGPNCQTYPIHSEFPPQPPPIKKKNPFTHAHDPKHIELLNTLARLQSLQTGIEFEIPQIIVCGAQSSGKSSVLEAITEIPFPRSGSTCTRFITKVTLKPSERESVTTSIQPGASSSRNPSFTFEPITNLANLSDELPRQFEAAAELILGGQRPTDFSTDTLCITICGPNRPILQILDLPGLIIHDTDPKNINLVRAMVDTEMKKPHSIILAVVDANNDPKTQQILALCYEFDIEGRRTVGIITHPDGVPPMRAEVYVNIALGQSSEVNIRHPWHVLRNRNTVELRMSTTIEVRNETERQFLKKHPWNQLGPDNLGVETLRTRLSKMLLENASQMFPAIVAQARRRLHELEVIHKRLGGDNRTQEEMENIFTDCARKLSRMTASHANGGSLYETSDLEPSHAIHLRSRIVEQGELFRDRITNEGHLWVSQLDISTIDPDSDLRSIAKGSRISPMQKRQPEVKSRDAEIAAAKKTLDQKRGMGLPLTWDSGHIDEFFWFQSREWDGIASEHITKIYEHCEKYFYHATLIAFRPENGKYASPTFTNYKVVASRLFQVSRKKLEQRKDKAERELEEIELDRRCFQININPRYIAEYRQQRNQRNEAGNFVENMESGEVNPNTLAEHQGRHSQEDLSTEVVEDFLRAAWIHYKVIERHFLDNISDVARDLVEIDSKSFKALVEEDRDIEKERDHIRDEIKAPYSDSSSIYKTVVKDVSDNLLS